MPSENAAQGHPVAIPRRAATGGSANSQAKHIRCLPSDMEGSLVTQRVPFRSRPIVWIGVAILIVAIAGTGYGFWYLFLRPSGPPPVNISDVSIPSASALAAS